MALTYIKIADTVLTTTTTNPTFSNIPATYTDLALRMSTRTDGVSSTGFQYFRTQTNNPFSPPNTFIFKEQSSVGSSRDTEFGRTVSSNDAATANTFGNSEVYIPNYLSSTNKPFSIFSVSENNHATNNAIIVAAALQTATSTISTIVLLGTFLSGSSFYLYGIKKD